MDAGVKNGLEYVVFTEQSYSEARQWVQDRALQGEIVASPSRLYLPVLTNEMTTVSPGDTIFFDPEAVGPNAFSVDRV